MSERSSSTKGDPSTKSSSSSASTSEASTSEGDSSKSSSTKSSSSKSSSSKSENEKSTSSSNSSSSSSSKSLSVKTMTQPVDDDKTFRTDIVVPIVDHSKDIQNETQTGAVLDIATTSGGQKTGRKLYLMRHAERMDRIFPGWLQTGWTDAGKFRPYDLNQPLTLPKRPNGADDYHNDPPITEMGAMTAQMVGRGMRLNKIKYIYVYSSPSLRCIQTANGILKTLPDQKMGANIDLKICVEPGLFEWMGWYETPPRWMTPTELKENQFPIDDSYIPILSIEEIINRRNETSLEYYQRCKDVIDKILQRMPDSGSILIVGHGTTMDGCSRGPMGRKIESVSRNEMDKLGINYPYCSVAAIEEIAGGLWVTIPNACPPITYLDFSNRMNANFFNRP